MIALLLALALAAPAAPAGAPEAVALDGARWREMVEAVAAGRERPPPGPWAAERAITFEAAGDGLLIRGRWTLRTLRPGGFVGDLFGAGIEVREATWDRRPAGLIATREGTKVAGFVRGEVVLEAVAFVPGDPLKAPLTLDLLPAVRGALTLPAADGDARIELRLAGDGPPPPRRDRQVFTGDAAVILARATRDDEGGGPLITASAGLGLTFGDAELRGRAHVTYQVRRGQLSAIELRATGLGADLTVTGRGVREWRREGDRVIVDLQAPVRDRLDLDLAWTQALPTAAESSMPLPQLAPEGVFRASSAVQIARDGEVEVLPQLAGWTPVTSAELPEGSRGLVEGTPTAAFTAAEPPGGRLDLLRYVPVAGPPVVVDVADYTIATSHEGRVLMQARYEVRNERAAHLRITPPPGMRILGARVAGDTALPARGPDGAWLIPLKRSLETVKGTLSFPVEVTLLGGDERPWRRREGRALGLPRVSAPIAVVRTTLHLPPGYTSRKRPGEGDVVDAFTRGEGITYGLAYADPSLVAEAEGRFQSAVSSFLANDFEAAQRQLEDLRSMGASNENIERLQANLDVIQGKGKDKAGGKASGADAAAERRVKEQARARASAEIQAQVALEERAESYRQAGDYARAEEEYSKAIAIGSKLALLEQDESVEQQRKNEAIESKYKAVAEKKKLKQKEQLAEERQQARVAEKIASSRPGTASASAGVGGDAGGEATGGDARGGHRKAPRRTPDGSLVTRPRAPAAGGGEADGVAFGGGGGGEVVYLFEDDDVDGEVLTPEGANIASRARARHDALGVSVAPTTTTGKVAALDETAAFKDVPVGGTRRDFVAVVDRTPTASKEHAGIRLQGTTAAESTYVVDGANVDAPAYGAQSDAIVQEYVEAGDSPDTSLFDRKERLVDARPRPRRLDAAPEPPSQEAAPRARAPGRMRRAVRRAREPLDTKFREERPRPLAGRKEPEAAAPPPASTPVPTDIPPDTDADGLVDDLDALEPPDEPAEGAPADRGPNDLGRLAAPQSTASALSVVIPAAGEAVLYQHLLLAADAPYALEIGAREPLRSRPRKRR